VGRARVEASKASQAGYTLDKRCPVVVKDLRRETRFSAPPLLKDHGVVSGVSVPMMHGDKLYGVLGAHTRSYREFTESDVRFMESIANVVTAAIARIEAERGLQRYAKELEQSNKLKELFTDIMRHDLQNPISIIKGISEILQEEVSRDVLEELQIIERNADKLLRMLDNAFELAKLESLDELKVEEENLRDLMESAVAAYMPQIQEKGMKVVFQMGEEHRAMVHPSMEDVFSNLVSNAVKYGRKNTEIVVGIQDAGEDWRVYVKDRGEGIRDEFKKEIFDRFKRKSKGGVRGTGLGLAIVKRIVDLHKGRVWVEDNPGGGSIFYVQIPKKKRGHKESKIG
jgi:signal transduction histidine kinase